MSRTLLTHWPSKSIKVGVQAPQARITLSASRTVPSSHSAPMQVVRSIEMIGFLNLPALNEQCGQQKVSEGRQGELRTRAGTHLPQTVLTPSRSSSRPTESIVSTAATQPPSGTQ
jgi:hypothetical protein